MGQLLQEKSPTLSIPPLPVFLYFCPIFPTHFNIFSIWSIHLIVGLPLGHFPSIFVYSISLDILSSLICITCPERLNLLFWLMKIMNLNKLNLREKCHVDQDLNPGLQLCILVKLHCVTYSRWITGAGYNFPIIWSPVNFGLVLVPSASLENANNAGITLN